MVVELGTHTGVSYSAFCQAAKTLQLSTLCFAIDTWRGDEHAGFYPDRVFNDISKFNLVNYASFSTLIRSTFDAALEKFEDGSIDLLHIDGLHTYEAVKHDFETWRCKLSENAVVLFHDIEVRERDFGVFRLWNELRALYPTFTFLHCHGLGVLCVGKPKYQPLRQLLGADLDVLRAEQVRTMFSAIGARWEELPRPSLMGRIYIKLRPPYLNTDQPAAR
jgi:hypothetical protein